eukprot:3327881-Rhodomonas_salina.2
MLPAGGGRARGEDEEAKRAGFADIASLEQAFKRACEVVSQEDGPISFANNSDKLRLYAHFKQVR